MRLCVCLVGAREMCERFDVKGERHELLWRKGEEREYA